ncbi:MAG TPA: c-type cytochrome biogenesis protein CcmI, partial [Reyranella sp.]|nr:c-type cytochrome biogenesis protein CcmI [Reyranella sp.]
MLEFLLALLTTATVGVLLVPLLRSRTTSTGRREGELAIYRDQLAEIERERAAGTLPESEAAAARIEVERRILAAGDQPPPAAHADATLHKILPPVLALAIPLLALGLYLQSGRPGLPAAPFVAGKPPPTADEPFSVEKLLAAARARLANQPDDPDALSALGEALTLEANGTVTAPAVDSFNKALANQPDDARALYYLGLHEAQSGDSRAALARWRALLAKSPTDAPFLPMLRAEIERVAKAAGVDPDIPAAPAGMPQPPNSQPSRE